MYINIYTCMLLLVVVVVVVVVARTAMEGNAVQPQRMNSYDK